MRSFEDIKHKIRHQGVSKDIQYIYKNRGLVVLQCIKNDSNGTTIHNQ